ncbi:MAG: hypothetical protein K6F53_02495 [Lachnospiraceae bacterium]|nr:hypothetical protein [Lachnospiraceae bacterium]
MRRLKHAVRIAAVLLAATLLCGCDALTYITGEYDSDVTKADTTKEETVISEKENALSKLMEGTEKIVRIKPEADNGEKEEEQEEDGEDELRLFESEIRDLQKEMEGLYYYEWLSEEEKYVYAQICYILTGRLEKVRIDILDKDALDRIFKYVMNDHPEIFYAEGYSYVLYLTGDEPSKIVFTGSYTMDEARIAVYQDMLDRYTADFLNALKTSGEDLSDQYRIVKFAYEYIINRTEYDTAAPFNQSMISVIANGRSVCSGYAKTMQYLLRKSGMEATLVLGTMTGGDGHAWNLVKCNDAWYYVDPTWGDCSYAKAEGLSDSKDDPPINYCFLLITTEEIEKNHTFDGSVNLPLCASLKDNYFVREGSYFTETDKDQLSALFKKAYAEGRTFVPIKMADEAAYEDMKKYLLEEQRIFDFVTGGKTSITYTENRDFTYMVFYL